MIFFTSNDKLETQFRVLEKNKKANICIHPVFFINGQEKTIGFHKGNIERFTYAQDVLNTAGQYSASSSYFFRRNVLDLLPWWFDVAPIGDLFLELYSMNNSFCVYVPKILSAYRTYSVGSWRDEVRNGRLENKIKQYNEIRCFLEKCKVDLESHLNFDYKMAEITYSQVILLLRSGKYVELKAVHLKGNWYKPLSLAKKMFLKFLLYFPKVCHFLYGLKVLINNRLEQYKSK
ncbi:hypothetical protein HJ160_08860 [Vibrio parahaemolyticus]|nr:hypothetical protein [Vibrio parahaemolyticus]